MIEDEIVREVRAAREAFAASYGYDIRAMVAALQAMDAAGDREVVRLAPRRPAEAGRPKPTSPGSQPIDSNPPTAGPHSLTEPKPVH